MGEAKNKKAAGNYPRKNREFVKLWWERYRSKVVDPATPPDELRRLEMAFFAGTEAFFKIMMGELEEGDPDMTKEDERLFDELTHELWAFAHRTAESLPDVDLERIRRASAKENLN